MSDNELYENIAVELENFNNDDDLHEPENDAIRECNKMSRSERRLNNRQKKKEQKSNENTTKRVVSNCIPKGKKHLVSKTLSQRPKPKIYSASKFSTELSLIFKKHIEDGLGSDLIQDMIINLLNQIAAVEDWFEIIKILIIQCSLGCEEFLNPATTKLDPLDSGWGLVKNGIGDRCRPLTIAKLITHHMGLLLSIAISHNAGQKNRKSIQIFLKNILITPTIFDGGEIKNMFGWYLLLLRCEPNLSKYYKFAATNV